MANRKPWTVLVYMVAEDPHHGVPLDRIAKDEKARLLAIGDSHPSRLHVAVQVDFAKQRGVLRQIAGKPESRAETIASAPRVLTQFMDWGLKECPADLQDT